MGWFRNNNNNNNENSSSSSSSSSLLTSWQVSALATVALPLFFFLVSGIFSQDGGGEEGGWWWSKFWNNDEERGGWWWWWQNDHQEEQRGNGGAALGFVYCWSLVLFGVLVWRGSKVLEKKKDYRALFAVLVVFANLAFLCWILVAGSGQGDEAAAEQGWMSRFSSVVILTFVFWTIFAVVFATILYEKARKGKASLFGSRNNDNDYQRQSDDGDGIV